MWNCGLGKQYAAACCSLCLNLIVNICSFRTILHYFLKMSSVCIAAVIAQNLISVKMRFDRRAVRQAWCCCCVIHFDYLCIVDALQGILHAAACFIFL